MTHEEIIAMAKEAGGYDSPQYPENLVMDEHDLGRFAALVAAKEREACAQYMESCGRHGHAAAIRARGQKDGGCATLSASSS